MTLGNIVSAAVLGMTTLVASHVYAATDAESTLIARGAYLARAGDCIACHSVSGGKPFAGGLPIRSPMGVIYSTNITPDAVHGIGQYSEQAFAAAVRQGVRADGKHLYPAMPYPDYQAISDSDIHALYTYFMKGVAPVSQAAPQTSLSFPFNQRWGMTFWNLAFTSQKPFTLNPSASMEINRGKYLVQTLGHCSSCHTPRGVGMQEKALDDSDSLFLSGGSLNHWTTPSLRGMPGWTVQDISDYLATGRNDFTSVGGEMTSVVEHSMQHMSDDDLHAIASYLKSLPANTQVTTTPLRSEQSGPQDATARTVAILTRGHDLNSGQLLYMNNCQACHLSDGKGAKGIFPRLNGARIVVESDPSALIEIILKGAQTPATQKAPSVLFMPGFEHRLNDRKVAELATFLRSGWENNAPAVSESDVRAVRKRLSSQ